MRERKEDDRKKHVERNKEKNLIADSTLCMCLVNVCKKLLFKSCYHCYAHVLRNRVDRARGRLKVGRSEYFSLDTIMPVMPFNFFFSHL